MKNLLSIPQARRVMTKPNIARLHAAGWLEHAVFFQDEEEEEVCQRISGWMWRGELTIGDEYAPRLARKKRRWRCEQSQQ